MKNYIKKLISKLPLEIIEFIFKNLSYENSNRFLNIFDDSKKFQFSFVKKYYINNSLNKTIFKKIYDACVIKQKYTDSINYFFNAVISFPHDEINVCIFPNAIIYPRADFIIYNNSVFYQKFSHPSFGMCIPLDQRLIGHTDQHIYINTKKKSVKNFQVAYSMLGTHTNAWAHFLLCHLPKLLALIESNLLKNSTESIPILFSINNHDHNIEIINLILKNENIDKCCHLEFVSDDDEINVVELYYCTNIGYFVDHSGYVNAVDTFLHPYSAIALKRFLSHIQTDEKSDLKKIYIGRDHYRTITNKSEVENYFIENGYQVIYPHKISLQKKIAIFRNVTHIAGPFSSGFINFIFSQNILSIYVMTNIQRSLDPLISQTNNILFNNKHKLINITGERCNECNPNSDFYIDMNKIKQIIHE